MSLALARPRMVTPLARYAAGSPDGVLILQRGDNPSTDYYLRPRLGELPAEVMDLDAAPSDSRLLQDGEALLVIVCRYICEPWIRALQANRSRIARLAFFMDDDLPAMVADSALPRAARGKVALHFCDHVEALSALAGEVWVSTPALAARYGGTVLPPMPEADPPEPAPAPAPSVVYHATDVHAAERRFVLEVARRFADGPAGVTFSITGDAALQRACAELPWVTVEPQLAWRDYLARQTGRTAAVSLAPLTASAVNAARAPVKAFDAARLGAAGLYADCEPYRSFVREGVDGLLLPMEPQAWADAISGLMADPDRRLGLARAAHARMLAMRRQPGAFPPPPAA